MTIEKCLNCGTSMIPMSDGKCPSCGKPWNVRQATLATDASVIAKPRVPLLVRTALFMKGRALVMALLGIVMILLGASGHGFVSRQGKGMDSSETVYIGIALLVIGALLFAIAALIVKRHAVGDGGRR